MENHYYNKIQEEKLDRKHLINFFGQLTLRDRVKFLAVDSITYKYLHQSEKSVSEHKLLFSNPNKVIFKSQILVLIFLLHQT